VTEEAKRIFNKLTAEQAADTSNTYRIPLVHVARLTAQGYTIDKSGKIVGWPRNQPEVR